MTTEDQTHRAHQISWRAAFGLALTVIWLVTTVWWTFYQPSGAWAVPANMAPNAWGDWAGGTFAPLAFLWLVLGYFQQGEELRDNVRALHLQEEALRLQVAELNSSVKQQTAMAEAAGQQAAQLEKSQAIALRAQVLAHQPRFVAFHLVSFDEDKRRLVLSIRNEGMPCYDAAVLATSSKDEVPFPAIIAIWHREADERIEQILDNWPATELAIEISYRDAHLVQQRQAFVVDLSLPFSYVKALRVTLRGMSFNLPPEGA